jgi:hypothetical protein
MKHELLSMRGSKPARYAFTQNDASNVASCFITSSYCHPWYTGGLRLCLDQRPAVAAGGLRRPAEALRYA